MLPIRPINEELYRLHLPIVSAEEDDVSISPFEGCFSFPALLPSILETYDSLDTLRIFSHLILQINLQGFSVTSMMNNSHNTHSTRRGSTTSRPEAIRRGSQRRSSGSSGPTPPLYPRPCCRHSYTLSNASSTASGGYNNTTVLYPVASTEERYYSHQHSYPYQHRSYQEQPRRYVHTTNKTIYTSDSGAQPKGRSW